ncbi:Proteophosphoglycan 5 [Rhodotorula toruloides ATCC 204091]|uniref:Proteophosphoglycan 5 n=1 Tax=Rhodotorula toruloides TaxID=5286 RepID=A0A0K3CC25_RHOTO|nr:Proteophosphoglycan 5 [Rhodotorula toruloides ATCC 204091]PRQ75547.1 Proteophosphoglycan 5 [Rhodotorula toruloides]
MASLFDISGGNPLEISAIQDAIYRSIQDTRGLSDIPTKHLYGSSERKRPREEPSTLSTKRLRLSSGSASGPSQPTNGVPKVKRWDEGLEMYRRGALRLTRTPGRVNSTNVVSLSDLVRPESLEAFASHSFIVEDHFLSSHLPVQGPHSLRGVPIYDSRPIESDPMFHLAAYQGLLPGINLDKRTKLTKAQHAQAVPVVRELHRQFGPPGLRPLYPWASGCAHSKFFLLFYPGFLLLVITSCNTMRIDMDLSDNHWYIHALPEIPPGKKRKAKTTFEHDLLAHMLDLDWPEELVSRVRGKYDFRSAEGRVHLVASVPGTKRATDDEGSYGMLRLNALARQIIPPSVRPDIDMEFCAGSVNSLPPEWIDQTDKLLRGRDLSRAVPVTKPGVPEPPVSLNNLPEWSIVFPTKATVAACSPQVIEAASNIGCCLNNAKWPETSNEVRSMFFDYGSKDPGRLFHMKFYQWKDSRNKDPSAPPLMVYLGSHNLSKAALGEVSRLKSGAGDVRIKCNNFELGVVIRGKDIVDFLEPGSSWDDIVPYVRPQRPYNNRTGDSPWNSPAWLSQE